MSYRHQARGSLGLIAIEETPDRKRVIVNRGVTSRC